jgi:hypothetical protein
MIKSIVNYIISLLREIWEQYKLERLSKKIIKEKMEVLNAEKISTDKYNDFMSKYKAHKRELRCSSGSMCGSCDGAGKNNCGAKRADDVAGAKNCCSGTECGTEEKGQ